MTIVAVVFLPLVLLYQGWSFHVFRRRVTAPPASPGDPIQAADLAGGPVPSPPRRPTEAAPASPRPDGCRARPRPAPAPPDEVGAVRCSRSTSRSGSQQPGPSLSRPAYWRGSWHGPSLVPRCRAFARLRPARGRVRPTWTVWRREWRSRADTPRGASPPSCGWRWCSNACAHNPHAHPNARLLVMVVDRDRHAAAATTTTVVVTTITLAALRTDAGSHGNRAIRRWIGFGRETVGMPHTHAHRRMNTSRRPP